MIIAEFALQPADDAQCISRIAVHCQRHRPIQRNHWRWTYSLQLLVETEDGRPVSLLRARSFTVFSRYRGLHRIPPGYAWLSLPHDCERFFDLLAVPSAAILFLQDYDVTGSIGARVAACVMQQHEREQALRFGRRTG